MLQLHADTCSVALAPKFHQCALVQAASDAVARPAFAEEKSLILLEELDVQAEMDTSLMAPLAKLIGRSKVKLEDCH